jgi:hypothetical protein
MRRQLNEVNPGHQSMFLLPSCLGTLQASLLHKPHHHLGEDMANNIAKPQQLLNPIMTMTKRNNVDASAIKTLTGAAKASMKLRISRASFLRGLNDRCPTKMNQMALRQGSCLSCKFDYF